MSLRIAPPAAHNKSHTTTSLSAPSAPGLHDTLRSGLGPIVSTTSSPPPTSNHPLEARLQAWTTTQEALKMASLRRTFGISEPIRRGMELKFVQEGEWRPIALRQGEMSVSEEILRGESEGCSWEDVFTGENSRVLGGGGAVDEYSVGREMEARLGLL